jgi:PAS domain S-box-containing protein
LAEAILLVSVIRRSITVRGTELHPDDTPEERRQKLDRITSDDAFALTALLTTAGLVLGCNRSALNAANLAEEAVVGKLFSETFWWSVDSAVRSSLGDAIGRAAKGEFVRYDVNVRANQGNGQTVALDFSLLPVRNVRGRVAFLLARGREIAGPSQRPTRDVLVNVRGTELLAGDSREHYREKLARITLDSMVQFVGLLDAKGTVLEINQVALDAVGIKLSDVEGKPFWTTFWWQVSDQINLTLRDAIARAAQGEFVRWDTPIFGRAGGKETIIIDASLMPVKDENGKVVFITAEGRDITEKKAHEREIARQREELAKLDVLKTQFFANVSHEFRTPLTLMLGPLEDALANVHGVLPMGAAATLSISHRNALRLLKLVNTMLDFSRIEAGRMQAFYQPFDLASLTAELASNFRSLCEKAGLRLIVDCARLAPDTPAYVDTDMWEKIVLNLVSNAFKFTLAGEIEVRLEGGGDLATLTVRDTGVGIPPEELPRMFERFHRVARTRARTHEGTGIGLALVHELVKLHGGAISLSSTVGVGSTFTVTIPLGKDHLDPERVGKPSSLASTAVNPAAFVEEALRWLPDHPASKMRRADTEPEASAADEWVRHDVPVKVEHPPQAGKARVLIADDNADMREYLRRLLSSDYELRVVSNGVEALAELDHAPFPDLILTDVMMPQMDGFELLRRIRENERTRTLPIIMLSARAGEEARVEGLQAGADDYLVKPFTARELSARLRSQIEMARSRRTAEQTVRAAQERLRLALEASSLGTWELDPQSGALQTDERLRAVFGFSRDAEITLAGSLDRIHPDDRRRIEQEISALMKGDGERDYHWTFRVVLPDGAVRWAAANGKALLSPVEGRAGTGAFRIVGTVRDITREKQSEDSMRETQKLESLGLLAGGIAHDFNNLLTGVIGNASLLSDEFAPRTAQADMVQVLKDAADRMSRLTSQMLAYSGRGNFVIESVDLSKQVAQITGLVQASIPKNVQLRLALANDLPPIEVDVGQLQQVIMNLIINAAEAVTGSGAVEITTATEPVGDTELEANVTRQTAPPGDYVALTVADNGCGMDEQTCARIFDPFFTTKFTGRGLGLSSVLGIVRGHKGLLTVSSRSGEGTKFRVFFPMAGRPAEADPAPVETVVGEGAILVVDDEEIVRKTVQASLTKSGYRVLLAANGEEALRIFRKAPNSVDAVLLDMTMPVMGGEETLQRLREIQPDVIVVAMSGFDEGEAKSRFGGGIAAFVHKPFTASQIATAIDAVRRTRAAG